MQAIELISAQHGHQVGDSLRMANSHNALHAGTLAPPPVQALAQGRT